MAGGHGGTVADASGGRAAEGERGTSMLCRQLPLTARINEDSGQTMRADDTPLRAAYCARSSARRLLYAFWINLAACATRSS